MSELQAPSSGAREPGPVLVSEYRGGAFRQPRSLGFALICSTLTGAMLWACYFPIAWGWLAWVALVPLLALVRTRISGGRLALSTWLAGLLFYWPSLQWMRVADYRMYATWAALATYCSLYFPLAFAIVRRLDRKTGSPLVLAFPVVWTALEYFRANFFSGFPWYFLAYSQHDCLVVTQVSDIGGAYAVSFLVAAVNALILEMLQSAGWFRTFLVLQPRGRHAWRRLAFELAGVSALLIGTLAYGNWRLGQSSGTPGPRIALLQGNIPQSARNDISSDEAAQHMINHYAELSDHAVAHDTKPDLLIWPETSFPYSWGESPSGRPDEGSRELSKELAGRWRTNVLLGLNTRITEADGKNAWYNSALFIGKNGKNHGRYDKIHRVPFGEYVPLRKIFPWMERFAPYDFDYSIHAGERLTLFSLGAYQFGALICYEDTDPYLARQYVHTPSGESADFLVNMSNDGWFDGTSEHEEHLAICRFRAIESRRAIVRAVNMGISGIIDSNGRLLAPGRAAGPVWDVAASDPSASWPTSNWHELKKIAAVVSGGVPIDRRPSLYAQFGDWLPGACWLGIGAGLAWSLKRRGWPA